MKRMVFAVALAMFVAILVGCVGGMSGDPNGVQLPNAGYIPTQLSQMANGGVLPDGEPAQQHDGGVLSLNDLEGQWICEEFAAEHRDPDDPESYVVTEKTMMLNDQKVECLPKCIDIRPYSPIQSLFTQGFGYGAASFADAPEPDGTGIESIEMNALTPYWGNGFICATHGPILALGFLGMDKKMKENGVITDEDGNDVDECKLSEFDYEVVLEGDRLTISCGDVSASYMRDDSDWLKFHEGMLYGVGLYNGDTFIDPFHFQDLKKLSEAGYEVQCNLDEMLPSLGSSEEFKVVTPDGSVFMAKVFNPYEKKVPLWFLPISWYHFEEDDGNLTVGRGTKSSIDFGMTQVFGVSSYAQVYNYYPLPYERTEDHLCYRTGAEARMLTITALGEGFDTGKELVKSEHSCDVIFGFKDGVLSSFTKEDAAYMAAGLQDNVERDDLAELEPSVYREVEEQRNEILDELKKAFEKAGLTAVINENTGEVTMDSNVLFASGSYELSSEGKAYLDKVFAAYASVILDDKFSASLKDVSFEGNTDSDGGSEFNMRLSENRAKAVMGYCSDLLSADQRGAFDELAIWRGYGESDLVYNERGKEDKDASRRVAIKFMMKVDGPAMETKPQSDSRDSSSSSATSANIDAPNSSSESDSVSSDVTNSATSSNVSNPNGIQEESDELGKYRSISSNFNQAWMLYEESENDSTEHLVVLLLSEDHHHCAYFDLRQDASTTNGYYTFGETSVEETGKNIQAITVRHNGDNDELDIIFDAWERDDMVSIKDPWNGVYDLTAIEDVEFANTLFEDVLA